MSWRRDLIDGFVEAALWSSTVCGPAEDGSQNHESGEYLELAEGETYKLGRFICRWQRQHDQATVEASEILEGGDTHTGWELVGHCAWLNMAGHGTGFWDCDLGDLGDRLSAACGYLTEHAYLYTKDGETVFVDGVAS